MDASRRIAAAVALFQQGEPARALDAVADLLDGAASAAHARDALNLAAACARALGRPAEAERYGRLALQRDPAHAASWNNLGILLQQQGRGPEAEAAYRRALALQPAFADAHYNLALLFQQAGAFADAAAAHERTLVLQPRHAGASANLGVVLERLGRPDEAERRFGAAAELDPGDADVRQRRADILQRLGRRPEAEACYRAALALRPDSPELHNNLAVLYAGAGRADAAEGHYRAALALRPDHADAWHNLGLLYTQQRRHGDAETALLACAALRPADPEVLNSLGNAYQYLHREAQAEQAYRCALALRPGYAKTLNNLGALLQRSARADEAEAAYRAAAAADPGYPEARWNLGFLLLAQGRLEEGWPWMEARHDPRLARPIAARPALPFPQWRGEDLAGRAIVVWPEQGFGDQVQFVRYLPLLKDRGARTVTFVCQDALVPLLRGAAGADQVVPLSQAASLPAHDYWVLVLSLPMHAGTTLATIPATLPYLHADPACIRRWRPRLDAAAPGGARVGLVWRGFGGHVNDANRSLPGLSCLAPLLALPGVSFFSLQRGMDGEAGVHPAAQLPAPLPDLGADIADFADTAAIVAQLDLVICVDTAVAHVAGALGTPCWVLLPAVHPDWRWMEGRRDSPWYPQVLRLYRQERPGDWEGVVAEVAADLAAWSAQA